MSEDQRRPLCMHAVMSRAFQQISCSSYCLKDMKFQKGPNETSELLFHLLMFSNNMSTGLNTNWMNNQLADQVQADCFCQVNILDRQTNPNFN